MSRVPPFPTRDPNRVRNNPPSSYSASQSAYDSRPDSTVSDASGADLKNSNIPARPSRSQLRRMPSNPNSTPGNNGGGYGLGSPPPVIRTRPLRRDSGSTTFSDREVASPLSLRRDREWDRGAATDVEPSSRRTPNTPGSTPMSPTDSTSPRALQTVISAFQSTAERAAKRKATLETPTTGALSSVGFGSYEEMEREETERRRREQMRLDEERRERMMGRQKDREKDWKGTGRDRTTRGEIAAVLDQIQGEWEFVAQPDFNPVDLALALLDENSSGKDMRSFMNTKKMLERALKGTIQKHAQTFAAALPHHAAVMSSLSATQTSIQQTRASLQETKESLGNRRADLAQLWTRGQMLDEMIKLVDEIEYLKSIPDTLESLISEKKLIQASALLLKATKIISKPEMNDIGALGDLKAYLSGQETTLSEILVDELQAHMYLKNFWCDTRWQAYTAGQQTLPRVEFDDEKRTSVAMDTRPRSDTSHLTSYLQSLNLKPNDSLYESRISIAETLPSGTGIASTFSTSEPYNPEADSFTYIETILESLAILGKLSTALDTVSQRLPMELYSLVESTIEEVNERTEFARRLMAGGLAIGAVGGTEGRESVVAAKTGVAYIYVEPKNINLALGPGNSVSGATQGTTGGSSEKERPQATLLRLSALENSTSNADHEVLRDLFWTFYSKMDAVCQSIRVVYEVANRIGSRKDFKDSSGAKPGTLFPFPELWEPIETEIRTLVMLHLTADKGGASTGKTQVPSISEALSNARAARDKGWQSFRFGDSDTKLATRLNKKHEEELNRLLRDSVPGLVAGTETSMQTALSTAVDDRFASAVPHRLLVSPDAFYVSILFHPTLTFIDRAAYVLPEATSERIRESSTFLDEFVLKVYLPLLEERVASLFLKIIHSPDAFLPDPGWKRLSNRPLIKAATELLALVNSLCAMQQTTPFHRDNYSRLILGVIIQFYQRCSDRFRELVSTTSSYEPPLSSTPNPGGTQEESHVAIAARWAQKLEVAACISALYALSQDDVANSRRICRQETRVELNFLTTETVNREDLVPSKNLHALGNLFHSLIWFMRQLVSMRVIIDDPLSPVIDSGPDSEGGLTSATPYFPLLPPAPPSDELKLPLTKPMALRFDALMRTYEQLAEYVLATLRIDTRCRTIHFLDLAMRRGNYRVDRDAGDPDPHIVDLNLDLGVCDDCANETLPPKERKFLFEGLGTLMEHLLISNARHIRFANAVGIQKIMRNMLAMQQNMKTITDASQDADFEKAKVYYGLFSLTPQEMLASIRKGAQFTLEEYISMLNFQCGVDQALGEKGAQNATDRNYHAYVTELHALAIEDSAE